MDTFVWIEVGRSNRPFCAYLHVIRYYTRNVQKYRTSNEFADHSSPANGQFSMQNAPEMTGAHIPKFPTGSLSRLDQWLQISL
jgi:hypothetical protein